MDVLDVKVRFRREAGDELPVLVWKLPGPARAVATSPYGGGMGTRRWVVNAQVPGSYSRRDPEHHLGRMAVSLGLPGAGVGMLTAADVRRVASGHDGGVSVAATVGLGTPVDAAAWAGGDGSSWPGVDDDEYRAGTINVVAFLPERLADGALVNAVATITEAKCQALRDLGLRATGTATDAVAVLCPVEGRPAAFGGPRSRWGARLARAAYRAVLDGGGRWLQEGGRA
ncbi:MAG TPA: adenosylcobinamide amidohydrolase [Acidimicrobiales bacterium]|nr:adenosylcobinamide amidohydrolase [Acidimicrobiales bacterium]